MNDAIKWINDIIENIPYITKSIYEDSKSLKTYGKAKKFLREQKFDLGNDYHASPEEQMQSAFNTMIDNAIEQLSKDSNKAKIDK